MNFGQGKVREFLFRLRVGTLFMQLIEEYVLGFYCLISKGSSESGTTYRLDII